MVKSIAGTPGNCNKVMKSNNSFTVKPISLKETKRIRREAKKQRVVARNYENVKNYKGSVSNRFTGYTKKQIKVEWKKCESIRNLHIYINPHTRCLKYGYEHSPAPTEHYVFESTAKLSNLGLATKIIPRYNTTVDK